MLPWLWAQVRFRASSGSTAERQDKWKRGEAEVGVEGKVGDLRPQPREVLLSLLRIEDAAAVALDTDRVECMVG